MVCSNDPVNMDIGQALKRTCPNTLQGQRMVFEIFIEIYLSRYLSKRGIWLCHKEKTPLLTKR